MPFLDTVPEPWLTRFKTLGAVKHSSVKSVSLVGGCVRDMMLGRTPFDWDVVVEGSIAPILAEGQHRFQVSKTVRHLAFLTATLYFSDGTALDVVTSRTETYARPAALPTVKPAPLADDFRRRDFTVNAMALHVTPERWGALEDTLKGREDLQKGLIRSLHDASFVDDPTRIYRAARYAGRYGWTVETGTLEKIREAVQTGLPSLLSPARRRNELTHLLKENDSEPAMKMLWEWGLWKFWSPAFQWTPDSAAVLSAPSGDPLTARLSALARSSDFAAALDDLKKLTYSRSLLEKMAQV